MHGVPITSVLSCAIDLWRSLEIDDDELLEIAIRDVSYQIKLHKEIEERDQELLLAASSSGECVRLTNSSLSHLQNSLSGSKSFEETRNRFNPRVDPTVLHLKIQNLTLHLERFNFRIEKAERRTIFDPIFEGSGTVSIRNLSIVLRIECARERIGKIGSEVEAPVLLVRELNVQVGKVSVRLHDTGADWLLNKAVKGFSESITAVVEANLKEQIEEQTNAAIEQMNSYFLVVSQFVRARFLCGIPSSLMYLFLMKFFLCTACLFVMFEKHTSASRATFEHSGSIDGRLRGAHRVCLTA